jgi:hypothetical protein
MDLVAERPNSETPNFERSFPQMSKLRFTIQTLAFVALTLAFTSFAQAQATRTWVSGVGDDVNPCSRTAPCKTFAGAISKTFIHGEIDALDPAGYGTLNITKSITVDGGTGQGWASVLASGTTGFIINIATNVNDPFREVILRNISINGSGASGAVGTRTGVHGINFIQGTHLSVENCQIFGFTQHGIRVALTTNGSIKVVNSLIEENTLDGINMSTTSGQVLATIDHTEIMNCGSDAIEAAGFGRANVSNSVLTHITDSGIKTSGNDNIVNADDLFITFCGTGLKSNNAGTPSHIRVSDTMIAQNSTGVSVALGGTIDSFQGNSLTGLNGVDGSFSTTQAKQ